MVQDLHRLRSAVYENVSFPHNLNAEESNIIHSALENPSNFHFTIHPLFVVLGPYVPRHLKANENIDNKAAFAKAYGDGKALCGLEERTEYNIMMGKKILAFFQDLDDITPEGPGKASFVKAGSMIKTKLEYLVKSLELQFPRLRRAKANNELNRTGVIPQSQIKLPPSLPAHRITKTNIPKAGKPSNNPNKYSLLPNRFRDPFRLQRHESHRRTYHVIPTWHLPRQLFCHATVQLGRCDPGRSCEREILDILGCNNSRDNSCFGVLENLVGLEGKGVCERKAAKG